MQAENRRVRALSNEAPRRRFGLVFGEVSGEFLGGASGPSERAQILRPSLDRHPLVSLECLLIEIESQYQLTLVLADSGPVEPRFFWSKGPQHERVGTPDGVGRTTGIE
jgi:hypothetical protein